MGLWVLHTSIEFCENLELGSYLRPPLSWREILSISLCRQPLFDGPQRILQGGFSVTWFRSAEPLNMFILGVSCRSLRKLSGAPSFLQGSGCFLEFYRTAQVAASFHESRVITCVVSARILHRIVHLQAT